MILTAFMMQLVRSSSSWAVLVLGPPLSWTPKPKITAMTIRGRMALRLSRPEKSETVKKLTTMSARPRVLASTGASTLA